MALSQSTKRRRKLVAQNSIKTAIIISQLSTPFVLETDAHKGKDVIYHYIDAWIRAKKISKTFIDSGAVVELISQKII